LAVKADERERWERKQKHYQDARVVREYDARRFEGALTARSTEKKWGAVKKALGGEFERVRDVLDVPCGTGRFASRLAEAGKRFVQADLSSEMLASARTAANGKARAEVRADAARLPFADESFDVVLSIRFLFHVPRELRPSVLRELARVARVGVVVDVRHKYCWTTWSKRLRAKLAGRRSPQRYSLKEIDEDFEAAGLAIVQRVWIAPGFSEKMVVFARRVR
jgi:ubiquinone/menaquinone biosynthesis C-methylase UbiE